MTGIMMHNMSHKGGPAPVDLVYNLDAANYAAVPTNGTTVLGTGTYTVTTSSSQNRVTWDGANGGVWRSNFGGDGIGDYIYGGPNWGATQSYTVFMAYKLNDATATGGTTSAYGRLLNSNTFSPDWLMGGYSGKSKAWFSNNVTINLNGPTDTIWHLDWVTYNASTNVGKLYSATYAGGQPTTTAYNTTNGGISGFNKLRLFSKADGNECAPADIGVIKVWNGVLALADIQTEYAAYSARFADITGNSMVFNGNTTTLGLSNGYVLGTSPYSVEAFVSFNNFTGNQALVGPDANYGSGLTFTLYMVNSTTFQVAGETQGGNHTFTVPTMTTGTWYHVAVCRSGSGSSVVETLFLNGVPYSKTTGTAYNYTGASGIQNIGGRRGTWVLNGRITGVRLVTGDTAYNPSAASITVPTAQVTSTTGIGSAGTTRFIIGSNNSVVTDSTGNNTLTRAYLQMSGARPSQYV